MRGSGVVLENEGDSFGATWGRTTDSGRGGTGAGACAGAADAAGVSEVKISKGPFTAVNSTEGAPIDGSTAGLAIDSGIRATVVVGECCERVGNAAGASSAETTNADPGANAGAVAGAGAAGLGSADETTAEGPDSEVTGTGTHAEIEAGAGASKGGGAGTRAGESAMVVAFDIPSVTDSTTARTA